MRIILPSGVIIESTDNAEADRLTKLVLNGAGPRPAPPKKSHHQKAAPAVETERLSTQVAETWTWLVAHDNPNGVHVHQVAEGLHITVHAATFRLNGLIRKGLARRIRRGWYRPGESPIGPETAPVAPTASEVVPDSPE